MTRFGPTSRTVTPSMRPAASNTDVMPTLRPIRLSTLMAFAPKGARGPVREASPRTGLVRRLHLDADVHAGRHVELGQGVHRLRGRLGDEDQALVRPDLELLAALLVDVGRAQHREALDP